MSRLAQLEFLYPSIKMVEMIRKSLKLILPLHRRLNLCNCPALSATVPVVLNMLACYSFPSKDWLDNLSVNVMFPYILPKGNRKSEVTKRKFSDALIN